MKLSDIILQVEGLIAKHGDMEIAVRSPSDWRRHGNGVGITAVGTEVCLTQEGWDSLIPRSVVMDKQGYIASARTKYKKRFLDGEGQEYLVLRII